MPIAIVSLALSLVCAASWPAGARAAAGFGFQNVTGSVINQDGSPDTQAGSHPYELAVAFTFNTAIDHTGEAVSNGDVKNLEVKLPAGLIGDPIAVPRCKRAVQQIETCPVDTEVGFLWVLLAAPTPKPETVPIYNLEPPPGEPVQLGGDTLGIKVFMDASVRTGGDYGVTVDTDNIDQRSILQAQLTVWGTPAESSHDDQRCNAPAGPSPVEVTCSEPPDTAGGPNPSGATPLPFLRLPTSCSSSLFVGVRGDSWENPDEWVPDSFAFLSSPEEVGGCERLQFSPTIEVTPETQLADTQTGLTVRLKVPQNEAPNGLAEADLKEAVVTLPAGMTVNPAAANGLGACSEAQIGLNNANAPSCPNESKLANVKIITPLLESTLEGAVYLAQQGNLPGNGSNPYGSLFAIYLVAEGSGVLVKLPGEITLDQSTGQLTARFGEDPDTYEFLPQLPFSELQMTFFGGPGAALVTPSACGAYTTTSELTPWSAPFTGPPATPQSPFSVSSGCADGFAPSFSAGTTSNLAGSFSPLTVSFSRQDGEQELHAVQMHLPPGLLGEVANVPQCGEAQANAGTCPKVSEIGTVSVAAGAGASPFWITDGHAYLTGPYAGRPFGLSIVVPAVAGPFNLGPEGKPIVVRAAISVNPVTAAVTITSESLPQILQGVPLQIRTVEVNVDRPDFTLNPTSCAPMSVTGSLQGSEGASAPLSALYQAAGCGGLGFKPSFAASTQAQASKADGASLLVKLVQKPGEANIHKVDVDLPGQLPSRLTTLQKACTEGQFNTNPASCPTASFIGTATARTPVLNVPLTGPAILVSHGGLAFPDVVLVLQGQGVTIELTGNTQIKKGITYSHFETVPDAPISSFELRLPESSHSVFTTNLPATDNRNLCGTTLTMPTAITGQNGAVVKQSIKITVIGCPKTKKVAKKQVKKATKPSGRGKR